MYPAVISVSVRYLHTKVCHFCYFQYNLAVTFTFPVQKYGQVMTVLKALTRSVMQVSSNVLYPLHLPICAEGRSAEDSAKGLD